MKTSEQIDMISKAVSTAQGEMSPASKSSINPFFKSTYSNLTQVWDAIREPLSKNGISVFQDVISTTLGISVSTRVCHASGQWLEFGPLEVPLVKKDIQSLGSATTYAKRYALCAAIGVVADEDDDGEKAMNRNGKQPVKQPESNPRQDADNMLEFLTKFDEKEHKIVSDYVRKYSAHWKKSISESIQDFYSDSVKFDKDLEKFKKKNESE